MSRDTESYANQLGKMEERPHRTRSSIVAAVLAAMLMVPSLDVRANCQDLVDDNIYLCRVKNDVDLRFSDCFRFAAPGSQSEDFDLFSDSLDGVLACDCKATGNFASPVFGAANSLHWVTPLRFGSGARGRGPKDGKNHRRAGCE